MKRGRGWLGRLGAALNGMLVRIEASQQQMRRFFADASLTVTGDQELLRRAVDNLLMNVLVHTPAGAVGAISASADGGCVTIEVSDDSAGVPPDHLPQIFERFYRAGTRSGGSGSGLGLAIAAEIASAHGGTAQAAPVSPHGPRVTLTLPARSGPRSAPEMAASVS